MKRIFNNRLAFISGLIILAAISRFIPHPPNITAILGMALFGGSVLSNKKLAFALPLAAMFLSDLVLGLHASMWGVYLAFAMIVAIGMLIRKVNAINVMAGSIAASVIFFIVTNFAHWLSTGMYPMNFEGLILNYEMAIPFFRNTLLSSMASSVLLFGTYHLVQKYSTNKEVAFNKV